MHLSASVALAKTRIVGRSLCTSNGTSVAFRLSGKKRTTGVSTRAAQSATVPQTKLASGEAGDRRNHPSNPDGYVKKKKTNKSCFGLPANGWVCDKITANECWQGAGRSKVDTETAMMLL